MCGSGAYPANSPPPLVIDFVRQFVDVAFEVWKVPGQFLADGFDSRHNTACGIALFESRGQCAGDATPKLLAHLLVDTAVSRLGSRLAWIHTFPPLREHRQDVLRRHIRLDIVHGRKHVAAIRAHGFEHAAHARPHFFRPAER
jgi:hypothetical protein